MKKFDYQTPAIEIVRLQQRNHLLAGSSIDILVGGDGSVSDISSGDDGIGIGGSDENYDGVIR